MTYLWSGTQHVIDVPVYDTIVQLKEKILEAVYSHQPYSKRPHASSFNLVSMSNVSKQEEVKMETQEATLKGTKRVKKMLIVKDSISPDSVVFLRPKESKETEFFNANGGAATLDAHLRAPGEYCRHHITKTKSPHTTLLLSSSNHVSPKSKFNQHLINFH